MSANVCMCMFSVRAGVCRVYIRFFKCVYVELVTSSHKWLFLSFFLSR